MICSIFDVRGRDLHIEVVGIYYKMAFKSATHQKSAE